MYQAYPGVYGGTKRRIKRLTVPTDVLTPGRDYGFRVPVKGLPDGHTMRGRIDHDDGTSDIDVEHPAYPPVPMGATIPRIDTHVERRRDGTIEEVICRQ